MHSYTVTLTLTNGKTITLDVFADSEAGASLKAKFSKKVHTTRLNRIVKAEVVLVRAYTPSPKVHTRSIAIA